MHISCESADTLTVKGDPGPRISSTSIRAKREVARQRKRDVQQYDPRHEHFAYVLVFPRPLVFLDAEEM